jgi:hypothetical protein
MTKGIGSSGWMLQHGSQRIDLLIFGDAAITGGSSSLMSVITAKRGAIVRIRLAVDGKGKTYIYLDTCHPNFHPAPLQTRYATAPDG